ncbi:MAG: ATP-dependent RecD-like DNA helicase [Planctomycetes bacterium]|nr:ATP-dependent RecD-like DNA helicase [Planctomycetota bacterium]
MNETLEGTVQAQVFRNEAGTFSVLRVELKDGGLETVTGPLPEARPGQLLSAEGMWVDDARFGRQFKARQAALKLPNSAHAIERYLAGGGVSGIGPELAHRIVEHFGEATIDVLTHEPTRLKEVRGIGKKKLETILDSWQSQQGRREALVFLRGHGLGPALAEKILARYGVFARRELEEDPYRLVREVEGVGFRTADRLAGALGITGADPRRLRAGLRFAAEERLGRGDVATPVEALLDMTHALLGGELADLEEALWVARRNGELEIDRPAGDDVAYLPPLLRAEREAARQVADLVREQRRCLRPEAADAAVDAAAAEHQLELSPDQRLAVVGALTHPLTVITGGPGVGKTTAIRTLVGALRHAGRGFALAAPTGRASRRLEETTGAQAQTLHRLLEWDPRRGGFTKNRDDPLELDLLVVDEASMIDLQLFAALVKALPRGATLVLTGDADQLPSVGAGTVLADLIEGGGAHVIRLTEVFRQAARSRIVSAAHAINQGVLPDLSPVEGSDFFFTQRNEASTTRDLIVTLLTERIPAKFGLDPLRDVQVLAPMRRGVCGTEALNRALKQALNPGAEPQDDDAPLRLDVGDKVMQLKNDYERDVFNGDVGHVLEAEPDGSLIVDFAGRRIHCSRAQAAQLTLAYCATIHKAQGSEYPAVVLPILQEHFVMLERNLLYTGLTRGRQLVVLVGQRQAVEAAVGNARPRRRISFLAARIQALLAS